MTTVSTTPATASAASSGIIDTALRLALVAALVIACQGIVAPFVAILLWATVLAVMLYPLHKWLRRQPGFSNGRSAALLGIFGVAILMVPASIVVESIGSSAFDTFTAFQNHTLQIPPPPTRVAELPVVGKKLSDAWALAAKDFPAAAKQYNSFLKPALAGVAGFAGGLASGVLSFVASIIIAAILVGYGDSASKLASDIFVRVTASESRGMRLVTLTAATIRGVAQGVVGVALIQAALVGIGFFAIGLPFAGLLSLAVLLLGIVQAPATLLTLPAIIYVFSTHSTTPAIIFAIYAMAAGLSDNFLKPFLLGRGLEVPMPVILIGVIGGMISGGLIGLFTGPVLLGVGYVLFLEWLRGPDRLAETVAA
jgi:predicted PurR-regulated permease PerM